jgi:hypothetical protein
MEVVDEVADLFAQESQQSVLSEILGLTLGKIFWMQQGYVYRVILPTPSQMMRHFSWLFRPQAAPGIAPVSNIVCSLAPSVLSLLCEARSRLLLPVLNQQGPGKEKNSEKCNPA